MPWVWRCGAQVTCSDMRQISKSQDGSRAMDEAGECRSCGAGYESAVEAVTLVLDEVRTVPELRVAPGSTGGSISAGEPQCRACRAAGAAALCSPRPRCAPTSRAARSGLRSSVRLPPPLSGLTSWENCVPPE